MKAWRKEAADRAAAITEIALQNIRRGAFTKGMMELNRAQMAIYQAHADRIAVVHKSVAELSDIMASCHGEDMLPQDIAGKPIPE